MSLVRAYDVIAVIFCVAWVTFYSRISLSFDGRLDLELLIGTSLAFWGRRSRIWAAALGGGLAVASSNSICIAAYYRQAFAEGRIGDAIADNPIAEGFQSILLGFVGALISGFIAAIGKEITRRDGERRIPIIPSSARAE